MQRFQKSKNLKEVFENSLTIDMAVFAILKEIPGITSPSQECRNV